MPQDVTIDEIDDDTITGAEEGDELEVEGDELEVEGEGVDDTQEGGESGEEGDDTAAGAEDGETDEVVITIGDEPVQSAEDDAARAPDWVRELRKSNREKDRRIRELEALAAKGAPVQQAVVVGEKPTLAEFPSADEIAEHETKLSAWYERKHQAEEQERKRAQAEEQERTQWHGRLESVGKAATALKVPDHDDAALAFEETFSITQQGIVMSGPKDPKQSALLRYALGKNQKLAKELASITNPVQFAFAVAELGTKMKVTPKKSAPAPERRVAAGGSSAANVVASGNLAKLQAEAQRTGDYTKYLAAKRAIKDRKAA
jgi:hypothetical protein